jgi:IS30 family transposase
MSYANLSQGERYQIQHLHWSGFSPREIGVELKTHGDHDQPRDAAPSKQHGHVSSASRPATGCKGPACGEHTQARIQPGRWAAVETRLATEQWSPVQIVKLETPHFDSGLGMSEPSHTCAYRTKMIRVPTRHDHRAVNVHQYADDDHERYVAAIRRPRRLVEVGVGSTEKWPH